MKEKIAIIGTGYIGLVIGACFAKFGHEVVFNDVNQGMLDKLMKGILPIHEQGLPEIFQSAQRNGLISVDSDKRQVVKNCGILIYCLPTPAKKDGNADLRYIREVSKEIGLLINSPKIIINKSTAPVGTSRLIREIIRHYYPGEFYVVSMPEFLHEGNAVESFLHADRYVIGFEANTPAAIKSRIISLMEPFKTEIVVTNNKTAELAKYICNAFLSLEISFINSMTSICEKFDIDIKDITRIMRLDKRVGQKAFLEAGPGYGGMCFPKDVQSIIGIADRFGYTHKLLQAVDEINLRQQQSVADKAINFVKGIQNPRIAILGLAFKKNTSDVRRSQAVTVIQELLNKGVKDITVYDPVAMKNFQQYNLPVNYADSCDKAINKSDCLIIMTEWDEFKNLKFSQIKEAMRSWNVVDARNLLDKEQVKSLDFHYIGMGRK